FSFEENDFFHPPNTEFIFTQIPKKERIDYTSSINDKSMERKANKMGMLLHPQSRMVNDE
ncbi:MAG: hypothetical protein K2I90_09975, partial [Odoribacter sp.]|nr:hypothetical protein [Odoribacter sp.]